MAEEELVNFKWANHRPTFFNVLSSLRFQEIYTDVTLACEGKFLAAHKLILATCSDYFKDVFEKISCLTPVVILKDIKLSELEALINFIYLGEVDVKTDEVAGVIKAAECLKIKGLGVSDSDGDGTFLHKSKSPLKNSYFQSSKTLNKTKPVKRRQESGSSIPERINKVPKTSQSPGFIVKTDNEFKNSSQSKKFSNTPPLMKLAKLNAQNLNAQSKPFKTYVDMNVATPENENNMNPDLIVPSNNGQNIHFNHANTGNPNMHRMNIINTTPNINMNSSSYVVKNENISISENQNVNMVPTNFNSTQIQINPISLDANDELNGDVINVSIPDTDAFLVNPTDSVAFNSLLEPTASEVQMSAINGDVGTTSSVQMISSCQPGMENMSQYHTTRIESAPMLDTNTYTQQPDGALLPSTMMAPPKTEEPRVTPSSIINPNPTENIEKILAQCKKQYREMENDVIGKVNTPQPSTSGSQNQMPKPPNVKVVQDSFNVSDMMLPDFTNRCLIYLRGGGTTIEKKVLWESRLTLVDEIFLSFKGDSRLKSTNPKVRKAFLDKLETLLLTQYPNIVVEERTKRCRKSDLGYLLTKLQTKMYRYNTVKKKPSGEPSTTAAVQSRETESTESFSVDEETELLSPASVSAEPQQ